MSKTLTYYVQTSAIDALTAQFGSCLQYLPKHHKTFILLCLVHQYSDGTPMRQFLPENAIRALEGKLEALLAGGATNAHG